VSGKTGTGGGKLSVVAGGYGIRGDYEFHSMI